MIECVDLHDVRNKHFVVSSMKDLFENVTSQNIVDFIKETLFRSTSKSRPNNIRGGKCPSVRTSVRPSVHKKFLRFQ